MLYLQRSAWPSNVFSMAVRDVWISQLQRNCASRALQHQVVLGNVRILRSQSSSSSVESFEAFDGQLCGRGRSTVDAEGKP